MTAPALCPIVIRFGRVGDMVMLSPLLNLLRRRYRNPCWLVGAGPWSTQLYRGHDDIAQIWSWGRHTPLLMGPTWWRVLLALRHSGGSPVYVCETEASPQLRRIRSLLTLAGVGPERCLFLNEQDMAGVSEHRVDRLLRFGKLTPAALQAANYPCQEVDPAPRLELLDADRLQCADWIRAQGWSGRPLILIQPGNRQTMLHNRWRRDRADAKAWSLSKWSMLLRRVHESLPQAQIVLCGSARERSLLEEIRDLTELKDSVALNLSPCRLRALCEVAHSMISVDTGPAHVAAAMGSPLVVLFGNSPPGAWLPRSSRGAPVIGLGGAPSVRHVDEISVQTVFQAWRSLWATG